MARPTTPEPPSPSILRVPDAPRWGPLFDEYEAFAPRKSARVAQRAQRVEGTPPPERSSNKKQHPSMASPPTTVKKDRFTDAADLLSPPSTVKATSRRKIISGFGLPQEGSRTPTAYDGKAQSKDNDTIMSGMESMSRNGMLPTPAKTPTSKKTVIEAGTINSVARNLFPYPRPVTVDEVMPSPKKKGRKKVNGFEISSDAEEETPIEIYTDTKDRVPELDESEDNPFYDGKGTTPKPRPSPRTTKRRKTPGASAGVADHTYGPETMGTNGAVFVFRGKKFWRSFEETEARRGTGVDDQLEDELDTLVPDHLTLPIKSGPFKGKWLFGEHPHKAKANEEEDTDIEEEKFHKKAGGTVKSTPDKTTTATSKARANTPPTTNRVTRAQKLSRGHGQDTTGAGIVDDEHTLRGGARGRSRPGNTTPFDHWSRTRSPMEDPSSRGSPVRNKRGRRGMATRSGGEASTAQA